MQMKAAGYIYIYMGSDWQVLKGLSSIRSRLDGLSCSRYT